MRQIVNVFLTGVYLWRFVGHFSEITRQTSLEAQCSTYAQSPVLMVVFNRSSALPKNISLP
jgi:hypothetical protein